MSVDLSNAVQGGRAVAFEGADSCVYAGLVTGGQLHSSRQEAVLLQGGMQLLQNDVLSRRVKVAALLRQISKALDQVGKSDQRAEIRDSLDTPAGMSN